MRYAVLNFEGDVVNIIELNNVEDWTPPEGHTLIQSDISSIGWSRVNNEWVIPTDPEPDPAEIPELPVLTIDQLRTNKIAAAWNICQEYIEQGIVQVVTSAGTHEYGTDKITQDNISKTILGILVGIVSNPRNWTPKNSSAPVQLTHDDLKLVGGTIFYAVDSYIQKYLEHKSYIMTHNFNEIESYDVTVY